MPLRDKAKSFFKNKSQNKDSSSTYKPGEPMPPPKYRATPKREHTEKLESFSFGGAWRRMSSQSQYSPMGTRDGSRRNSVQRTPRSRRSSMFSFRRGSVSGKNEAGDRNASVSSADTARSGPRREITGAAIATTLNKHDEEGGDDDVGNGELYIRKISTSGLKRAMLIVVPAFFSRPFQIPNSRSRLKIVARNRR